MLQRFSTFSLLAIALMCSNACVFNDKSMSDQYKASVSAGSSKTIMTATRVYGQQGSFTTNAAGINADGLFSPRGVAVDSTGLYVSDYYNHRVLFYPGTSTTATRVYGQGGSLTSTVNNNGGISANSLSYPTGLIVDSSGVYVADSGNCRVLFFPNTATTATRVYGQLGSFTSGLQNNGGVSADSLKLNTTIPTGLTSDTTGVYIADTGNNRVLFYAGTSTTASRVYGQSGSFSTTVSSPTSPSSLFGPSSVAVDSTGVYVGEFNDYRALYFPGTNTTAIRVYGQGSFTQVIWPSINASGLHQPVGFAMGNGGMYISDYSDNRVLFYPGTSTVASQVYGQPGIFTSNYANNGGVSASSLSTPIGIALDSSGKLYVADSANNRVLVY